MGKHFGNLQKLKGVYYYTLSPIEIQPFMMMREGFKNTVRKSIRVLAISGIPISLGFLVYYWTNTTYHELMRKNPENYKNDV